MEKELSFLALKVQFLSTLTEDELDKVIFYFANLNDDSESGIDDEVLEECEAYGVTWEGIISFMDDIRARGSRYHEMTGAPDKDVYAILSFFAPQMLAGHDVCDELAKMLYAKCGIKKDAVLALSIARDALFANRVYAQADTYAFADSMA